MRPQILDTFAYEHLVHPQMREISKRYHDLAHQAYEDAKEAFENRDGLVIAEVVAGLRDLRKAKDQQIVAISSLMRSKGTLPETRED